MPQQQAVQAAAERLRAAQDSGVPADPVRGLLPAADLAAAYAVQEANTVHWIAAGRRPVGRKIGATSAAVQTQLGVDQPDYGMLFADMVFADGDTLPFGRLLQPRVEGEVAFVLKADLDGAPLTIVDVIGAVDYAVAAIEVVDSRIGNWDIRIVDTVADNASSGLIVLGTQPRPLAELDLPRLDMVMRRNGETVSTGNGAACLGNPLVAVLWLARKMVEVGRPLQRGDIVLSGALGPLASIGPGDLVDLHVAGLGSVRASFSRE